MLLTMMCVCGLAGFVQPVEQDHSLLMHLDCPPVSFVEYDLVAEELPLQAGAPRFATLRSVLGRLPGTFPRSGLRGPFPCLARHRAAALPSCHEDLGRVAQQG